MKTKTIKLVSLVLCFIAVFMLPASGLTVSEAGIVKGASQYLYTDALKGASVQNFNSTTIVSVEFTLMFTGFKRDTVLDHLRLVQSGQLGINKFIIFGDGNWYESLDLLEVSSTTQQNAVWYGIKDNTYISETYQAKYRNYAKFRLTYYQTPGFPNRVDNTTFVNSQKFLTKNTVDFSVSLPWYSGENFECYFQLNNVTVSAPRGARSFISGGGGNYYTYISNTFSQPFLLAQQRYFMDNPTTIYPPAPSYQYMVYTFDASGSLVEYGVSNGYRMEGEDTSFGLYPMFYRESWYSQNTDFTLNNARFYYNQHYIQDKEIFIVFSVGESTSSFPIQQDYTPAVFCYTSFEYTSTINLTFATDDSEEFDVSELYVDITFDVPEWGEGDNFGENLGLFFVGFLEAILTLCGNCFYNAAVWIFCETPVLSQLTKPLFLLMVEAGSIVTDYFIPFLGALGFFTPIVGIFIVIGLLKKYGGVKDD